MNEKTSKRTKAIVVATISIIVVAAVISIAFFINRPSTRPSEVGYWILNISLTQTAAGYVTPNGTVHVPMNQTGITVTATPTGWNGFMFWMLDGEKVANQSSTIFVPRQQVNSSHTLEAQFVIGTPPIYPIVDGQITINASSYEAYNFTIPSAISQSGVSGTFTASGAGENNIKVYIMDSTNFANWQNGQNASRYYDSGEATNGTITVALQSGGPYFLVYDNTFDMTSQRNVNAGAYFWYIPK